MQIIWIVLCLTLLLCLFVVVHTPIHFFFFVSHTYRLDAAARDCAGRAAAGNSRIASARTRHAMYVTRVVLLVLAAGDVVAPRFAIRECLQARRTRARRDSASDQRREEARRRT